VKLMRRVGRDVDGLAFLHRRLHASKCSLDLTLKEDERLLINAGDIS